MEGENMLKIQLRRAITPEETGEHECAICGAPFVVGGAYAWPMASPDDMMIDEMSPVACPQCVEYFGRRNPSRFPTREDLGAAEDLYPRPMLESVEEALRREDEGTMVEVYAAAKICRDDLIVR
jgi:hypothetical protein